MVLEDNRRRELSVKRLNEMDGVSCHIPEGSIYAFPDFGNYGINSDKLEEFFLDRAHVTALSGLEFGKQGAGHIRICFGAVSYNRLNEGLDRIQKVLPELASVALPV